MQRLLWTLVVVNISWALATAQNIYQERDDAGDLPRTAQLVQSAGAQGCQTPVDQIQGTMGENDVDMYVICITNPAAFSATTVGATGWDTQLWLFRCDGRGVVFNDDFGGSIQSRIDNSTNCLPGAGIYLLAITRYNRFPVSAEGSRCGTRWATRTPSAVPMVFAPTNQLPLGRALRWQRVATPSNLQARSL